MNKILGCFLGALSLCNVAVCYATEKFDILPDLPDPLAYAVQPAEAASVSGGADISFVGSQAVGHEPNIISVVFSLIFVVLLIYATGIIYAKLNRAGLNALKKQHGDSSKSYVSVVSTTQLGNNKTLHVVELDGKRMLIGASQGAIQLIKDLGSVSENGEEQYSHIEIPNIKIPKIEIPKIEIPSIGFSKLVTKAHSGLKEIISEEIQDKEENSTVINEEEKEEVNPEGIIDTLFSSENNDVEEDTQDTITSEHVVDPEEYVLYKKYLG